jgi:serine/threonine protein phosphatase 1
MIMAYAAFKFFGKNPAGRDFVVGDIHGSFSALEHLLSSVNFDQDCDRLFSVGDMIDRGLESHRFVEFLNYPWFYSIMGNHERMLLDSIEDASMRDNWIRYNGGAWWKTVPDTMKPRMCRIVEQLPLAFEVSTAIGQVGVVHADIPTGISWKSFVQSLAVDAEIAEYALWSRNRYKHFKMLGRTMPVEGIDVVVFGHTPMSNPLHTANFYYIDTGASLLSDKSLGRLSMLQIHPVLDLYQFDTRHQTENILV